MYKQIYFPEFGLAGLEDPITGLRVFTIVMQPGEKKAAIMAYAGARYSRSQDSIPDILRPVFQKLGGTGAAERIENIVHTYGHPSVADMSHNMIFIERVPIVTSTRFYYLNAKQDGQERSTRFQNFSTPEFYPCPQIESSESYQKVMHMQIDGYNALHEKTHYALKDYFQIDESDTKQKSPLAARTFDTLRHTIPMGMRTNFCAIMSSRDWARYIGWMRGSSQGVEQVLGNMLFDLMVGTKELSELGYVPESDTLIRHADANNSIEETTQKLLEIIEREYLGYDGFNTGKTKCLVNQTALQAFIKHLVLLTKGYFDHVPKLSIASSLAKVIFTEQGHYDRKQLGPIFQSGAIALESSLDIGALKDYNRQRSLERFIPFLDNCIETSVLLRQGYNLCDYLKLPEFSELRKEYQEHFDRVYTAIKNHSKQYNISVEELRYLLPHAHQTPYVIYGSFDDLMYTQALRVRPGGHINYRMESWRLSEAMQNADNSFRDFWRPFAHKHVSQPNPASREEFLSRA